MVGIAGGPEKCRVVLEEFGFDACIDYKHDDVAAALKRHCPKGVNVVHRETVFTGLESCVEALNGLFTGANIGKMLVKVSEPTR